MRCNLKYMQNFFGCCQLRTAVMIIAVIDLLFGIYELIEFGIMFFFTVHHQIVSLAPLLHSNATQPSNNFTHPLVHHRQHQVSHNIFYTSIIIITIGCLDVIISSFLLYVAASRHYSLRVIVLVAAVWGLVMALLNFVFFILTAVFHAIIQMLIFVFACLVEIFFAYVIFSYYKFMTVVVERGLDGVNMSYFAEEQRSEFNEIQMEEAIDERPIMEDQDDLPEQDDAPPAVSV